MKRLSLSLLCCLTFVWGQGGAHFPLSTSRACVGSGSGTAQICSTSPTFTPASGDEILFTPSTSNTGDVTLNANSTSSVHIRKWSGAVTLDAGDLVSGVPVALIYDGSYWEIAVIGNVLPLRTWSFPWDAVNQGAIAGTNLWLPSTNGLVLTNCVTLGACTATAGSSIRGLLNATTNQATLYGGYDLVLPSGYVSGSAVTWTVNYETNDLTAGHTPKIVFTSACIPAGTAIDNPTYGNSSTATLAVPTTGYAWTVATGSYTPPACAAGSLLSIEMTPDTTTGPVAAPGLLLISGSFSVHAGY